MWGGGTGGDSDGEGGLPTGRRLRVGVGGILAEFQPLQGCGTPAARLTGPDDRRFPAESLTVWGQLAPLSLYLGKTLIPKSPATPGGQAPRSLTHQA